MQYVDKCCTYTKVYTHTYGHICTVKGESSTENSLFKSPTESEGSLLCTFKISP